MIHIGTKPLSAHVQESDPPVAVVLPHPHDRALVRTALGLAGTRQARVRAWALREPGDQLPAPLRVQLYGLWTMSEADRAIRHLVDSAIYGAHIPVGNVTPESLDSVKTLPADAPLLFGWVRGGERPPTELLCTLATARDGCAALVVDQGGRAFEEVLVLDGGGPELDDFVAPLRACYPVFQPELSRPQALERALGECRPETLVVIAPSPGGPGPLEPLLGCVAEAAAGTIVVLLPRGESRAKCLQAFVGAPESAGDEATPDEATPEEPAAEDEPPPADEPPDQPSAADS